MKKVEVIYVGERADPMWNKIWQTFRNAKGELYRYQSLKNIYVGECYWTFDDGKIKTRPEKVEKPKLSLTDQERRDYEAHKEIAKQVRLERRKAMELKRPHPDIVKAINLLKPFCINLGPSDLSRFTQYLKEQLGKRKSK